MSKHENADQTGKVVQMFESGKQFTEDVLEENKRLRLAFEAQKARIRDLEAADDSGVPSYRERLMLIEEENLMLKGELLDIKKQFNEIEKENWDFSERYLLVEHQNTSLLNLYVAAQRLHSTLSFGEVIQVVKELVVYLVGSESFDFCLYHKDSSQLRVLATLGTQSKVGQHLETSPSIKSALDTGESVIPAEDDNDEGIVACVPLKLGEDVLGVIVIRELLTQKSGLEGVDYELFDLLAEHAASAVCSSYLFTKIRPHDDATKWHETISEMSKFAITIEEQDVEPSVIW